MREIINLNCPSCASNGLILNPEIGKLQCKYCGKVLEGTIYNSEITDLTKLKGNHISKGANKLDLEEIPLIRCVCPNCGAKALFNKNDEFKKCHWCNTVLTTEEVLDKPLVPDQILPFSISKEKAKKIMEEFVSNKQAYASNPFLEKLDINDINGVYLPYFLVDVNSHTKVNGKAVHEEKIDDDTYLKQTFNIDLEYDLTIPELIVEASNNLDVDINDRTNRIISLIKPFDTQNCVEYNPNYLVGYSVDQRDLNINVDKSIMNAKRQFDIVNDMVLNRELKYYNRGIKYKTNDVNIVGTQWASAYLPVWLYSHREKEKGKEVIHYIAINGRTGEVCGSVPFVKKKALLSAILDYTSAYLLAYLMATLVFLVLCDPFNPEESQFFQRMKVYLIFTLPAITLFIGLSIWASYSNTSDYYSGKDNSDKYKLSSECEMTNKKFNQNKIKEKKYKEVSD